MRLGHGGDGVVVGEGEGDVFQKRRRWVLLKINRGEGFEYEENKQREALGINTENTS